MKKRKSFHSLSWRLMLLFALLLIVFSLLLSAFYTVVIRRQTIRRYSKSMQRFSYAISQNLYDLYAHYDRDPLDENRFAVSEDTLAPYLALIEQMTNCNVYVIDLRHNVTGYFDGVVQTLQGAQLSSYIEQTIALGFMGKTPFVSAVVDGETRLAACAPIMNEESRALGVVLLDASLRELGYTQVPSLTIFAGSLVLSLSLSFVLAFVLSRRFTRPIKQVERFALSLAGGEYQLRMNTKRRDEIGSLAHSMDILAGRLEEAKALDERIHAQQKVFFSNISHELHTPVTVIRGSLEALYDGVVSKPEDVRAYYRQMIAESRWLQKLIADLLELSRLQNLEFSLEESTISLSELLGDVAMSAGALCERKGLVYRCEPPERDFTLTGDYARLRQMLLAVVDNAVKYSPPGNRVSIRMDKERPIVSISDEGVGIPAEELPHIFDRFHHTHSSKGESTGLGLAIAQEIARRHGVEIAVESQPDVGSTFLFDFSKAAKRESGK